MTEILQAEVQPRRASARRRRPFKVNGYFFFLLPGTALVFAFTLFPAVYGIWISFTNLNLGYVGSRFVGLANYVRFFTWPDLGLVTRNTATFVGAAVLLQVSIGLALAILLNQRVFGHRLMRSIAILPWVLPSVVVALIFAQVFSGSRLGIVNYIASLVGVGQMAWFADPALAMSILVICSVWRGVPFSVVILLGGLQTLPRDVYEAAIIDGASAWQRFRFITLPLLQPIILITLIMATAGALNSLDIPLALTGGGPGNSTELIAVSLYKQSFFNLDVSYGATIGTIMLIVNIVLIVCFLAVRPSKGKGE